MRLLLDTHVLLWWFADDPALPATPAEAIASVDSDVFVSAATAWEIVIKQSIGRLDFPVARLAEMIESASFSPLAISIEHAVAAGALPRHHADPFDRMLVAQACCDGLTLVTVDPLIKPYGVSTLP